MVAKQIADFITATRGLLVFIFPSLGVLFGEEALSWAAAFLAANWTGDSIDGPLARRSSRQYHTWVGDHDLEIDIAVSIGLLIYMLFAGFMKPLIVILYLLGWAAYFKWFGIPRSMGMLFQAPIYAWFIYVSMKFAPVAGWVLIAWVMAALVLTWPKFPEEVVPDFINGVKTLFRHDQQPNS